MAGMDEKAHRRRLRFRLSTVLTLTAIVAWGMSYWPFYDRMDVVSAMLNDTIQDGHTGIVGPYDPLRPGAHEPFSGYWGLDRYGWFWKLKLSVEKLVVPLFVLVVFLTWKAAWAIGPRTGRLFTATASIVCFGCCLVALVTMAALGGPRTPWTQLFFWVFVAAISFCMAYWAIRKKAVPPHC